MSNPHVSTAKQIRRIERRRRERAVARIAALTLQQQWDLACAIYQAARRDTAAIRTLEALYA